MPNRIEYQELIDLDGYRKAVADSRAEYASFVADVTKLNKSMQDSMQGVINEITQIRKANANTDDGKTQELYARRAQELSSQLKDQRAASAALATTQQQLEKVTGSLLTRQEQLLTQYANLNGTSAKVASEKKRIATELVNLQNQFDKLSKSTKINSEATKEVTGQFDILQKELADSRRELKNMTGAFDENTGRINKNNAAAVALAQKITLADRAIKGMGATMGQHQAKIDQYENAFSGLASGGVVGLIGSFGLLGIALSKTIEIGGQALDKMAQFEQIRGGLKGVTKDSDDLAHVQAFLEQQADRLGISYAGLSEAYKGIKVGTKDTALEGKEADRIFAAFTTRLAELKAPSDKAQSALKALSDMLSRGNITAEDLKDQLGQALPGSTKLFADAMGIGTQELQKMMQKGDLLGGRCYSPRWPIS